MSALVTERWSDRRFRVREFGQRGWDVTGVADAAAALAAVALNTGGAGVVDFPFTWDSRLRGQQPEVELTGPASYRVIQAYNLPAGGTNEAEPDSPVDVPYEYEIDEASVSESQEVDGEDSTIPILNTAGLPFDSTGTRDVPLHTLGIYRNESEYDASFSAAWRGAFNKDVVTVPRVGVVQPGRMQFVGYKPTSRITANSTYVPVVYRFLLGRGNRLDADGYWDAPFTKYRVRSQGFSGWYNDGGTKRMGAFVNVNGVRVTEPVLLNASGVPFNATVMVEAGDDDYRTPVAPASTVSSSLLETTASAVYLKYRKTFGANFNDLFLWGS